MREAVAEAVKREEAADAKRANAEAQLRRLDNERAYLRAQLTSEASHAFLAPTTTETEASSALR